MSTLHQHFSMLTKSISSKFNQPVIDSTNGTMALEFSVYPSPKHRYAISAIKC